MNKIVISFTPCSPPPLGGYKLYYRVAGSDAPYILAGTFFISPAIFYDTVNPSGTCYEGVIASNCGNDVVGNSIPWASCESGGEESGESGESTVFILNNGASVTITDISGIPGFALDGPVESFQFQEGTHDAFAGAIGVIVSGTPISGSLSLFKNGILLECQNIGFAGGYVFSSFSFLVTDIIQVRWFGGPCF